MRITTRRVAGGAAFATVASLAAVAAVQASSPSFTPVPNAQPRTEGISVPNALPPELAEIVVAQGSNVLENPDGTITNYGYYGDGPFVPAPGGLTEAQKSEPDKNTYLVMKGLKGTDPDYDYGTHFLFQGHEGGPLGYITRVNLDADDAHRVTLLGKTGEESSVDGSTWYPFAKRILVTGESADDTGGVWQVSPNPGNPLVKLDALGTAGYEGIQGTKDGTIWLVADIGGPKGTANPHSRQPNSFVYRFIPKNRHDLTAGGKLQALQVSRHGSPIVFHAGQVDADITSADTLALRTGASFPTKWVTVHDTATDGTAFFDANAAAKAANATPLKRPENGVFKPDGKFREFYFTETGDTDLRSEAGQSAGAFGGIFHLSQRKSSSRTGRIEMFYQSDSAHGGLDNIQFLSKRTLVAVQDYGDTAHGQTGVLDSAFAFDTSDHSPNPQRIIAEGRDASATIDSAFTAAAVPGFQNDGDNEITGFHVSNGDPGVGGLLGTRAPKPFQNGWRVFWTQQHGDNNTFEIVPAAKRGHGRVRGHR
jgi:hypothetical protein